VPPAPRSRTRRSIERATHALAYVARSHIDDQLFEARTRCTRLSAEYRIVGFRNAPPERRDVSGAHAVFHFLTHRCREVGFAGEKHADGREVIRGDADAALLQIAREQLARRLAQDARAVARAAVRGARAAMLHRRRRRQGKANDVVRGRSI
jgi:hypothetical protein